jgi:hypothetical protein
MALPKIFISSTYYDLKQERNNLSDFISSLGYEAILHEKSSVTYTQNSSLEHDCYNEIINCDILICIIGNHFGSHSGENEYSITMNELKTAIKARKKVFIFIMKDVFVENITYLKNKDNGNFVPAFADNIMIHEFIAELKKNVNSHPITPFDDTSDIIKNLKNQFAGMFQRLLMQEATLTTEKTSYDLQETADKMQSILNDFMTEQQQLVQKINSGIFNNNLTLQYIRNFLGLKNAYLIINDITTLDEFMSLLGFTKKIFATSNFIRVFTKIVSSSEKTIKLSKTLFNDDNTLKDIRDKELLKNLIITEEKPLGMSEDDLPF